MKLKMIILLLVFLLNSALLAGPYFELGVNGYIDPNNHCWHGNPDPNYGGDANLPVNPIFRAWATDVADYSPTPDVDIEWTDPYYALGPTAGDNLDVVSLGDLYAEDIGVLPPGQITLIFGDPCNPNDPNHIRDVNGYDFVVFENSLLAVGSDPQQGYKDGEVFAELAYVEVSTNGVDFAKFPSVSLTPSLVGPYGSINISNIYNLAGKHINGYGTYQGTPFDLVEITDEPNVVSGMVDVNNIVYVRIIDVPGSGDFFDEATENIDFNSWPNWQYYSSNHPIYDAWVTWGSGGFDLEAIGVLRSQNYPADINLDGIVDLYDLTAFISSWLSIFGDDNWNPRCDMAQSKDLIIDFKDFSAFSRQWYKEESWSSQP